MAVAVAAFGGLCVPNAGADDEGQSASRVTAMGLSLDASGVSGPWREPGVADTPVSASTVRYAESDEAEASSVPEVRGPRWTCNVAPRGKVLKSGRQLHTYAAGHCVGRPGKMRVEYWFDRSSWSGPRQFTDRHRYTSWTIAQAQGTTIYAQCGVGGTYDYSARVSGHAIIGDEVFKTPTATSPKGRYKCGTTSPA
ncbi:hypothetical protein ACGFSB_34615 [Streptomyces sp. NPDC048441]|uniref:hypothetical protein n=1 Tax=Streptomyces sp. NPDC048441 TaxID=3365552 RepID=UPI00371B6F16